MEVVGGVGIAVGRMQPWSLGTGLDRLWDWSRGLGTFEVKVLNP